MTDDILRPSPIGRGNPELWQLKYEVEDDRFLLIFADFARLIRRSEKACEDAARQGDPGYVDFVGESESEYIEEIIGASFLVLQTKIRRVTGAALDLHQAMLARHNINIVELANPASIRRIAGRYKRKRASLVELAWDVGNYYKHRDEWPAVLWRGQRGVRRESQARRTRRSVQRLGIVQFSTGNLRRAYEFFDIVPYSNCVELANRVQDWANMILGAAVTRLREHRAAGPRPTLLRRRLSSER
jgi:hypothetical protein